MPVKKKPGQRPGYGDETIQMLQKALPLDCFTEFIIGPAEGGTLWLARTALIPPDRMSP